LWKAESLIRVSLAVGDWEAKVPESDRIRQNPIASSPESLAAGKQIYADKCAKCHAPTEKAKGTILRCKHKEIHSASAGQLEWLIDHGNRWHGMPGYGSLAQEQRWQLVSLPTAPN
jgi:mono/diheme cytochrome c family protein